MCAAVIGDRLSLHPLHDEVRASVAGLAAVKKTRDAGMLESRQHAPLVCKPAQDLRRIHAALDELHRDFLFESSVGALGEINLAHPAAAKWLDQPVDADEFAVQTAAGRVLEFALITTMNVGEGRQQSEWIEQWTFDLAGTGFG